jgi:Xaa-Pro dipeptidase
MTMLPSRISHLIDLAKKAGLDAIALNPGPSLAYLSGMHLGIMERPMILVFTTGGKAALILPELELLKTKELAFPVEVFPYGDNPATWAKVFRQAVESLGLNGWDSIHHNGKRIGVEPTHMRVLELRYLEAAAPQAKFISASDSLATLRLQKEPAEINLIRKAIEIAQRALQATLPTIRPGVTEREIAAELTIQLLRKGSEAAFMPIVSSGPNSANPHATPTNRKLGVGDLLVIDWGAIAEGYISDLTRTFAIGKIDPELERIAEIVRLANAAGRAAGRPGIAAGRVDQAARAVIEEAGYAVYFTHRTGHGIGIEIHEDPYIFKENTLLLAPGMTYTVEPGIYLPGRGGVRIEDDVVITAEGCETLSDLPRELQVI